MKSLLVVLLSLVCLDSLKIQYSDYTDLYSELTTFVGRCNCGPILVRLAWHDSGTYDKESNTGGPRAVMRFEGSGESTYGCNAGLDVARRLLQPIVDKFSQRGFSVADIWATASVVAIEVMGGPKIPIRFGRIDAQSADESVPDGRLPDGDKGLAHLRDIFYRMGFNDREIVALSGAHTLGRAHKDRSGFVGPWTEEETRFDNSYFILLLQKKWVSARVDNGQPQMKIYSTGNPQVIEEEMMMLTTDYAIFDELDTRAIVEEYAANQNVFFKDFAQAYQKLIELGYNDENLYSVDDLEQQHSDL